jgi:hypothetical protein
VVAAVIFVVAMADFNIAFGLTMALIIFGAVVWVGVKFVDWREDVAMRKDLRRSRNRKG